MLKSLVAGISYWWEVKAYNSSGWGPYSSKYKFTILSVSVMPEQVKVRAFDVHYSNSVLRYALPDKCYVSVKYYDVKGRTIASFVNKVQETGYYMLPVRFAFCSEGPYIQIFKAGSIEKREIITLAR
jgi:hypothetical protein